MVYNWRDDMCFSQVKNLHPSHRRTKESMSDTTLGQKNPSLYVFSYEQSCARVTTANPYMDVLQDSAPFIWSDAFH
jgi:hypothetical protein